MPSMCYLQYAPGAKPPRSAGSGRNWIVARGPAEFERALVLQLGRLSISDQLVVVVPENEQRLRAFAHTLSAKAPNVAVCAEPEAAFQGGERGPDGRFDIIRAVAVYLKQHENLWDPDDGLELPRAGDIELERDLGLTPCKLDSLRCAVSEWCFDTHLYSRDELLGCLYVILEQLLKAPDVDPSLQLSEKELLWFALVCRAYYRTHVYYHNFYHCVDVVQCVYLLHKELNPWQLNGTDILAHVMAALGHDMLHPGLTSGVLRQTLPRFATKFRSLETYHTHVFLSILRELWPAASDAVQAIVRCSIAATELEKHESYLQMACPMHSIKFADLSNVARPGLMASQRSAIDIFLEMRTQHIVCEIIGAQPMKITADPSLPAAQVLVGLQVMFLSEIACPYFEWLAEQIEMFRPFCETARGHLRRWFAMQQSGNLDLAVPFSPPAASGCQTREIPLFHAIP